MKEVYKFLFFVCEPGELAQWVKVPAARPDDLSSVPRTHMVDGEKVPSDHHMSTMVHICAHTTENN